jgi:hypothetical protein
MHIILFDIDAVVVRSGNECINLCMYVCLNLSICQSEKEYLTVFVCLCVNVTPPNEQEQTDTYTYGSNNVFSHPS